MTEKREELTELPPGCDGTADPGERHRCTLTAEGWLVLLIALVSLAVRTTLALSLDVFQDEAIYWRQGHAGVAFCPHPPAVPALARLGDGALGQRMLGLRAASLLWGTASILLAYLLGRDLYGRRAGVWAAALFASCPLFVAIGMLTTPDAMLVFLWLLFVWTAWRAARSGRALWWAAAGVVFAAGLYTKYMMVLAAPCALAALASGAEGRAVLRRRGPWLAILLGLALFLGPFLAWEAQTGWTTLGYHLASRHEWSPPTPRRALIYVTTHAGALSPVLCLGALAALAVALRSWWRGEGRGAWLLAFGAGPILFFLAPSLFTERELTRVQWDEIGYAAAVVALAGAGAAGGSAKSARFWRRTCTAALAVALVMTAAGAVASIWPGLPRSLGTRSPARRMLGWRELAGRIGELEKDWPGERPIIVTHSFRSAVCLGFHLGRLDGLYTLPHKRNERYGLVDQLNEWGMDVEHLARERGGRDALFVSRHFASGVRGTKHRLAALWSVFATAELIDTLVVTRGGHELWTFYFYRCTGRPDREPE